MKPNRQLIDILRDERERSCLVRDVVASEEDEEQQIKQLDLRHSRWVTAITFLHEHKPRLAKRMSRQYQTYKAECRSLSVKPLAPWLYDYEHWIFLISIGVISIDPGEFTVDRHGSNDGGAEAGFTEPASTSA